MRELFIGINVKNADNQIKSELSDYLKKNNEILIEIDLGCGKYSKSP